MQLRYDSDRASKSIVSFGALLDGFELKVCGLVVKGVTWATSKSGERADSVEQNIVDDDILNRLQHIRAKFKVITTLLGLRGSLVYSQEDVNDHKNMSF